MTTQQHFRTLIIIPARYASTRYPGKPLAMLSGATGVKKPLIQRSWEAACLVPGVERVVVATDSIEIKYVAEGFGAEVVMTSEACKNGTERCAEVAQKLPDYDIYVNLQGDAPLTPPAFVRRLIEAFHDTQVTVATPALLCDQEALASLKEDRRQGRVGGTTVVFNQATDAMYFSKEVLPYVPEVASQAQKAPVYHHVGVYAYKAAALKDYVSASPGVSEESEGLEQLRFLEMGSRIRCVMMPDGYKFWELNNPTDIPIIERHLLESGIE